mgnify:CR=1 FL=1
MGNFLIKNRVANFTRSAFSRIKTRPRIEPTIDFTKWKNETRRRGHRARDTSIILVFDSSTERFGPRLLITDD